MGTTRKVPRHAFSVNANLHQARGTSATVVVRDISTLGCQVERAQVPKIGKRCELYFEWQGRTVGVEAQVVWGDDNGRVGLMYQKVDEHSQKCLQELCITLEMQRMVGRRATDAATASALPGEAKFQWAEHPLFPAVAHSAAPKRRADPESVRRKLPRYISELRGDLLDTETGRSAEVFLVDLSISGARLEGTGLPDSGRICQLRTEWEGVRILLPCKVAWKTKKQAGMKFTPLDDETAIRLREICAGSLIAPPGPRG